MGFMTKEIREDSIAFLVSRDNGNFPGELNDLGEGERVHGVIGVEIREINWSTAR